MSRPLWFVGFVKKTFPSRFLAAKATKVPILGSVLDRWLFEGDDLVYLPRNSALSAPPALRDIRQGPIESRVLPIDRPIDTPGEMVLPSQVVEHFIEKASYHWIMNTCICRDAQGCKDYPIDRGCLFLGEATLGINPRLGRRVTKEEALAHVRHCREAGLVHLIGRNKLDTIWLGIGPGDKLLTICNCCPCCCLWRVLPYVAPRISDKVTRMPGVTVQVSDRCVGCSTCTHDVCFMNAIRLVDGRAAIDDVCRGCGRCVAVCPQEAIEIFIDHDQFVKESIRRIAPLVDVA